MYNSKMHDSTGRTITSEMFFVGDTADQDPRRLFENRVADHFSAEQIRVCESDGVCFAFGVYVGPWRIEWDMPIPPFDDDSEREALLLRIRDQMIGLGTLSRDHWQRSAGAGWLGYSTPGDNRELRLYDSAPIVLAVERTREREAFSALWFMQSVKDAMNFASAIMPSVCEPAIVEVRWHLMNPLEIPLKVTHPLGGRVFTPQSVSLYGKPGLWTWDAITIDLTSIVERQARSILNEIHDAFLIPRELRPVIENAR